jgi:methylmalonyl-CoA mutase cobalamin-binding subunit
MTEGLVRVNDSITYKVYQKGIKNDQIKNDQIFNELKEEGVTNIYTVGRPDDKLVNGLIKKIGHLPDINYATNFVVFRIRY